jgi:hypothetical protein
MHNENNTTNKNEPGDIAMPTQLPWQDRTLSLAERHEQLSRTSRAMWLLLKSKLNLDDVELLEALRQIEHAALESNRLIDCHICRHPLRSAATSCLYCGSTTLVNLNSTPGNRLKKAYRVG